MISWLDGAFVEDAKISGEDRGFLLGDGAFETIYAEGGRCAFLSAHLGRLERGLEALGIALPMGDWRAVAGVLAERNGLQGRAVLRLTVSRGAGGRGLAGSGAPPTALASLSPLQPQDAPLRLHVAGQRRSSASAAAAHKLIGGYVDNIVAQREARAAGADEAVMLNEKGAVACAAAANIFLVSAEGAIATPRLADGALAGVIRGLLLEGDHGAAIEERRIDPREISRSAVFLTNSLRGVAPCAGPLPSASAGLVIAALKSWYSARLAAELATTP